MNKLRFLLLLALALTVAACATLPAVPTAPVPSSPGQPELLGAWQLVQLAAGHPPAPNEVKTLTFQNDGVLQMDLWEHRLTFKYTVSPDPAHLQLTWVGSTNPNDQPGGTTTQPFAVNGDSLMLNGDQFKRIALASGATLTPPASSATTAPTSVGSQPTVGGTILTQLGQPVVLHVQQTALVQDTPNQFGIHLNAVKSDSRCPASVNCVVAGSVTVQISFQENGALHPPLFELTTPPDNSGGNVKTIDGYTVTLLRVDPARTTTDPIPADQYAATFVVASAAASTPPPSTVTPQASPVATVPTVSLDQPFTLNLYRQVAIPDAHLTIALNAVLEDSRCPRSVNCVVAGRALLAFTVTQAQHLAYFTLSTQPPDARTTAYFRGYVFELKNVQPYPETPDQKIPLASYAATLVIHRAPPPASATKNEPLVLRLGQPVQLTDENAVVTLEQIGQDSRCPTPASCFVRGDVTAQVKLQLASGPSYTFVLHDDSSKPTEVTPDDGTYAMELLSIAPYPQVDFDLTIAPQDYEITVTVRKFATPIVRTPTPTPAPSSIACTDLSAANAQSILGVAIAPRPSSGIVISAHMPDEANHKPRGICGYLSVSQNPSDVIIVGDPRILTPQPASYGVAAAQLSGLDTLELLRVANLIHAAAPAEDAVPLELIQTRLAAGDVDGVLDSLVNLAQATRVVHTAPQDNLGARALWFWRPATPTSGSYAALLVRTNSGILLLEALTPTNITESAAQESMLSVARSLIP